jgi:hypothetical protein
MNFFHCDSPVILMGWKRHTIFPLLRFYLKFTDIVKDVMSTGGLPPQALPTAPPPQLHYRPENQVVSVVR